MINNFKQIEDHLYFVEDKTSQYQIMVIVRKKEQEQKENHQSARIIKYYYVNNLEDYKKCQTEIVYLCEIFNARAYINLNPKDITEIGTRLSLASSDSVLKRKPIENYQYIYHSVYSDCPLKLSPLWLLDCDNDKQIDEQELEKLITKCRPQGEKIIDKVITPNGYHLITRKFSRQDFAVDQVMQYKVENKECSPTLLYYPSSLER